jgi:hypothetical protein
METHSSNLQGLLKIIAVLAVFLVFFSIPVLLFWQTQEQAKNIRITMDMKQLKNWSEVYRIENKNYKGFEKNPDLNRFFEDIKSMEGEARIFVSNDYNAYCARVLFKKGSFCVDNLGYSGKDNGICSPGATKCN